jgi:hypothetical protein
LILSSGSSLSGRVGELESWRVGEWENGRVGEWERKIIYKKQ